jgi:endonuclease/exonuclease/phosphatase family metal-dependent hydrolase
LGHSLTFTLPLSTFMCEVNMPTCRHGPVADLPFLAQNLIYTVHHHNTAALLHPPLVMDPPRDSPAVPPGIRPPRDELDIPPCPSLAYSRRAPVPTTLEELRVKPKRNRYLESPEYDSEGKRHKPSQMITQINGSFCGRYDGDEDDNDELKMRSLRIEVAESEKKLRDAVSLYEKEKLLREKAESEILRAQQRNEEDLTIAEEGFQRERFLREEAESDLRTAQERIADSREMWQTELAMAKESLQRERFIRERAQDTTNAHQAEIEHLKAVNATMMSDLNELRELENEVAAKHKDEHLGLPPAYGSLNDEDRFPPYSTHEDGGTIEVAHLKREIRQKFDAIVNKALLSEVEKRSKLELFGTLADGLSKACFGLRRLLDIAPSIPVSCVRKPTDYGGYIESQLRTLTDSIHEELLGPGNKNKSLELKHPKFMNDVLHHEPYTYLPGYAIMQRENSAPYVADRIAKLILELLWRFVTACEIRPGVGTSPNAERTSQLIASIMLHFTQVDLVLLKALQLAFSHRTSTTKLQYHLSQLQGLNQLFMSQMFGQVANRRFLARTRIWLNEQVEKERAACTCMDCRAAVEAHPELFAVPYGDRNNDDAENDGVSSRWEGSDAGSGRDDVENEDYGGLWPDDNPRLSESPGDFEVEDGYWG